MKHISKLLSLALRHKPETLGLELDEAGWVAVDLVLEGLASHGTPITPSQLEDVVRTSDKQRFALSPDGKSIRANQGHTVDVDLGYEAAAPPDVLLHGTVERFLPAIRTQGLLRGQRHHVHLSANLDTAERVGQRRGRAVILQVHAKDMARDGHHFFLSTNGVWLTEHVPPAYIVFPGG
jgi:putative RNA 2'-phosphotransferase